MDSILKTIKQMLGFEHDYHAFDQDIIININMVFNILNQLGVGPKGGFYITGDKETWNDYISDMNKLQMVKTYIYLKVKAIFDPGTSSALNNAIDNQIKELEWRLNVQVDPGDADVDGSPENLGDPLHFYNW